MYHPIPVRQCETAQDVFANAAAIRERRKQSRLPPPKIIVETYEPVVLPPYVPAPALEFLPPGQDLEVDPEPTIRDIQRAVCVVFGLHREDFLSDRRTANLTGPRHICFVLCRALTTCSTPKIGRAHRGRDHSTIVHGIQKYRWMLDLLRAELTREHSLAIWAQRAKELYQQGAPA